MLLIKDKKIKFYNQYLNQVIDSKVAIPRFYTDDMLLFHPLNDYFIYKIYYESSWKSERTIQTNAQHLLDFFIYIEDNDLEWNNLNNSILNQWRDNIKECGILGAELSNNTVNQRLQAVIYFYNWCFSESIINEHPFLFRTIFIKDNKNFNQNNLNIIKNKAVSKLKNNKAIISVPTLEEVKTFLEQKMPIQTKIMALLMYETGLRKEEVCSLKEEQFNIKLEKNKHFYFIHLNSKIVKTKGNKSRDIVVEKSLLQLIKQWIKSDTRIKYKEKFKNNYSKNTNLLFISQKGNEIKDSTLNKAFEKICIKASFKKDKITPHILRHSFATHNLVYNLSKFNGSEERMMDWLSNRLGHSSISTTREFYIHFVNELKIKEEKVLSEFEKEINKFNKVHK